MFRYFSMIAAFAVCAGLLPVVQVFTTRWRLFDPPGPLKIHQRPVARLGGIAMMGGALLSLLVFLPQPTSSNAIPMQVFVGIWIVGLLDDLRELPSYLRFAAHLAAGAALWSAGWGLGWFRNEALDLLATCVFTALVINSLNLLDGMDGLAASSGLTISLGFLILAIRAGDATELVTACALLGICAGMLSYNAPPARMFMGDSGSTLIGILLAFLSLHWIRIAPDQHSLVVPAIFLAIPCADVLAAVVRRARSRGGLFHGDRRHYYDLLLRRGGSTEQVLNISVGATGLLVLTGWLCARGNFAESAAAATVFVCLTSCAYLLGSLQPESPAKCDPEVVPIGHSLEKFTGDGNVNL